MVLSTEVSMTAGRIALQHIHRAGPRARLSWLCLMDGIRKTHVIEDNYMADVLANNPNDFVVFTCPYPSPPPENINRDFEFTDIGIES